MERRTDLNPPLHCSVCHRRRERNAYAARRRTLEQHAREVKTLRARWKEEVAAREGMEGRLRASAAASAGLVDGVAALAGLLQRTECSASQQGSAVGIPLGPMRQSMARLSGLLKAVGGTQGQLASPQLSEGPLGGDSTVAARAASGSQGSDPLPLELDGGVPAARRDPESMPQASAHSAVSIASTASAAASSAPLLGGKATAAGRSSDGGTIAAIRVRAPGRGGMSPSAAARRSSTSSATAAAQASPRPPGGVWGPQKGAASTVGGLRRLVAGFKGMGVSCRATSASATLSGSGETPPPRRVQKPPVKSERSSPGKWV